MTVNELICTLMCYPSDMNVKVAVNRRIEDLDKISQGVDMDSNVVSVWLFGREE